MKRFCFAFVLIVITNLSVWCQLREDPEDATNEVAISSVQLLPPVNLRCEYLKDPRGIDTPMPRFSWQMRSAWETSQGRYRIIVASSLENLTERKADMWDSDWITSNQSHLVEYRGKPLQSGKTYYWKVRLSDQNKAQCSYSRVATFQMGMLSPNDWQGDWIAGDLDLQDHQKLLRAMPDFNMEHTGEIWKMGEPARQVMAKVTKAPAVYLRHEFATTGTAALSRATAFISGLGMHELYLNGEKAGDHVLSPAYSDYEKRALYETLDVTSQVRSGQNAIGVILGNGWFNLITPHALRFHTADYIAPPRLRLNLVMEYADGTSQTVVSSPEWQSTTEGPIRFNCVLAGETYDARKEMPGWSESGFNATGWVAARKADGPKGKLEAQMMPPVRVITTSTVAAVLPHEGGWRFDLGVESTGWVRLRLHGKPGQRITISYPGSGSHTLGRYQTCEYICKGTGDEVYAPRFSFSGYRYVDVKGLDYEPAISDCTAELVDTDLTSVGSFSCSDERLNKFQEIVRRTLSNYIIHIPMDPTREKAGWTEDIHTIFPVYSWNLMAAPTFINWQKEFALATQANGYVPPVVPSRFDGPDINGPWWGGVVIYTPWNIYQRYGDQRPLEQSWPAMERQFGYLHSIAKDNIVEWGLGDWLEVGSVTPKNTPVPQTSTAAYYYFAGIMEETARLLGKPDAATKYAALRPIIKSAYNAKFLDAATGKYAKGSQTSQLISIRLGLMPDDPAAQQRIKTHLYAQIAADKNHLSSGFIGIPMLLATLTDLDRGDLAWKIATQPDYPGIFDAILSKGHSVLKEDWGGGLVQMPTLMGPFGTWFYEDLGGIQTDPASPGMQHFLLKPDLRNTLTSATARHESPYGWIESEWQREGDKLEWKIRVPSNTSATLSMPAISGTVKEADSRIPATMYLVNPRYEQNFYHADLPPGYYELEAKLPPEFTVKAMTTALDNLTTGSAL